jgi:hypothetical protein
MKLLNFFRVKIVWHRNLGFDLYRSCLFHQSTLCFIINHCRYLSNFYGSMLVQLGLTVRLAGLPGCTGLLAVKWYTYLMIWFCITIFHYDTVIFNTIHSCKIKLDRKYFFFKKKSLITRNLNANNEHKIIVSTSDYIKHVKLVW